jgi:hypothetical protein
LAELVGIILGDGSFYLGSGIAELDIAFNLSEQQYCDYVCKIIFGITGVQPRKKYEKHSKCVHLRVAKKIAVRSLLRMSIVRHGNKIANRVTIPPWVRQNTAFKIACLRGLIDTDGSVHRMSNKDYNRPRVSFKNNNSRLLNDARNSLIELEFHPSKIIRNQIFISRKSDIVRFNKVVGFNNLSHKLRLNDIAP